MAVTDGAPGREYELVFRITDTESGLDESAIALSAFTFTTPDGSTITPTLTTAIADGVITARLRFTTTVLGTYSVSLVENSIGDKDGNFIDPGVIGTFEVALPSTNIIRTFVDEGVPPGWSVVNAEPLIEADHMSLTKVSGSNNWGAQYMQSPPIDETKPVRLTEIVSDNDNRVMGIHENPASWLSNPDAHGLMLKAGDGKLFYSSRKVHDFPPAAEDVIAEMLITKVGDDAVVEVFHDSVSQGTFTQVNAFTPGGIVDPRVVWDAAYTPAKPISANYWGTLVVLSPPAFDAIAPLVLSTSTELYTFQAENIGGFATSWEVTGLPPGWSYSAVTGLISATPSDVVATQDITISSTNAAGTGQVVVSLTVNLAAPNLELEPAIRMVSDGSTFSYALTDLAQTASVTWAIADAPAGWAIDPAAGVITGPLTQSFDGSMTATATNAAGSSSVDIPLAITTPVTGTPVPATTADFESLTALPAGFVAENNATVDFLDGWLKVTGSDRNYQTWVTGPVVDYREGDRWTFEFRAQGIAGVGLTAKDSDFGGFKVDDSMVYMSRNSGDLSTGDTELARDIGHSTSKYYQLSMHFNDNGIDVVLKEQQTDLSYTVVYFRRVGIPGPMFSGLRPVFAVYNNTVWVKQLLHEQTEAAPAGALFERAVPSGFMGYNSSPIIFADWDAVPEATLQASMEETGTGYLRFTGDVANYGYLDTGQLIQNGADVLPDDKYGTPNNMPPWLAYRTARTGSVEEIKKMTEPPGIERQGWTVNAMLSTPAAEVARLQVAAAAGHRIDTIEIGNELFIPNLNYMGDDDHPIGFRTPDDYAKAVVDEWVPALKAAFPSAKVLAVGVSDSGQINERFLAWMPSLIKHNAFGPNGADGISLHPYYYITDIGLTKASVGDRAAASSAGTLAFEKFRSIVNGVIMGGMPPGTEIYTTEYGLLEDITQTGFVVIGQSWLHGVLMVMHTLVMWADPRMQGSAVHSLIGNPQWAALHDEAGVAIDPAKRGIDDEPWTTGLAAPLSPTLMGVVLGIVENEVAQGGGDGLLLANADGLIAWRITQAPSKDKIVAVNVTGDDRSFELPIGATWSDRVWTNDPWLTLPDTTQLAAPAEGTNKTGNYTLPGFTLSILEV